MTSVFIGLHLISLLNADLDTIKIPAISSKNFDFYVCAVSPLTTSDLRLDSLVTVFNGRILFKDFFLDKKLYPDICPKVKFCVFIGCRDDSINIGVDLNQNNTFESNEIVNMPANHKTVLDYIFYPRKKCNTNDLVDSTIIHLIPFVNQVHHNDISASDTMLQISYSRGFIKKFRINDTLELESHSSSSEKGDSTFISKYIEITPSGVFAIYPDKDLIKIQDKYFVILKNIIKDSLYLVLAENNLSESRIKSVPETFLNGLSPLELKTNKSNVVTFNRNFILVDFWATYCVPCINAMPHLNKLNKKYNDKLQIISFCVDINRNIGKAKKLIKENNLGYEQYFVAERAKLDDSLAQNAGVVAYPTYILLDNKGNVLKLVNDISGLDLIISGLK